MKRTVKKILLSIPGFEALCRALSRSHVRTLMYHRFAAAVAQDDSGQVDGETLRGHLDYIKRHHVCWRSTDHWQALQGLRRWDTCPVVITVDDGYRDFFEVAFPVLREAEVPAMVFLTTGFVDGRLLLWWDRLKQLLDFGRGRVVTARLDGAVLHLDLTTEARREKVWNMLADRCRFLPHAEKELLVSELAAALGSCSENLPDQRFAALSWSEVQQMEGEGIQFGAHTVSHPILSRLPLHQAQAEIEQSRQRLEAMLQRPVDWFCYPQGGPADYTPEIKDMVRTAGFKGCYVAHQDITLEQDLFALPRYCASSDSVEFHWCLCGAEYLFLKLRAWLGKPARPGQDYWSGSESLASAATAAASANDCVLKSGAEINH